MREKVKSYIAYAIVTLITLIGIFFIAFSCYYLGYNKAYYPDLIVSPFDSIVEKYTIQYPLYENAEDIFTKEELYSMYSDLLWRIFWISTVTFIIGLILIGIAGYRVFKNIKLRKILLGDSNGRK